uniref:MFS domain-containing protein n=1 Tax=Panagrellus redivivus TaxID=6233 RepID=A0A7E4W570_PANRE
MSEKPDPVAVFLTKQKPSTRICLILFGAVMIHLSLGTYHTFGNMLPYMASYMRNHTDPTVNIETLMWIPTFQGSFPFAMIIGGFMTLKWGPRLSAAIGCYTMVIGVFLSYYTIQMSYHLFLFTYGFMFGLGQGIAYVVAVTCVINWAPEKVGLVSGIVAAGFGVSSAIFAPIQTALINPENLAATKEGYFDDAKLLQRVPGTFLTLGSVYVVMQTVGLIFICDPPADFVRKHLSDSALIDMAWLSKRRTKWLDREGASGKGPRDSSYARYSYSQLALNDDSNAVSPSTTRQRLSSDSADFNDVTAPLNDEEAKVDNDSDTESEVGRPQPISLAPSEVLRSSTFYWLFVALFCCSFYGNLFYNLYKTYGETFIEDDMFLAVAFSLGTIANAAGRIGWGLLTDKTSFQVALSTASCLATALLLTMPLTAAIGKYMYLVWLIMMFICLAATHALFITAAVRCFGSRYKATNYGCLILSTTLSGIVLSVGCQNLLSVIGYSWTFIVTAAFPFTAFLITSAIRVTPQGHLII